MLFRSNVLIPQDKLLVGKMISSSDLKKIAVYIPRQRYMLTQTSNTSVLPLSVRAKLHAHHFKVGRAINGNISFPDINSLRASTLKLLLVSQSSQVCGRGVIGVGHTPASNKVTGFAIDHCKVSSVWLLS